LKSKRLALALALAATGALVSGCGQQAYSENGSSTPTGTPDGSGNPTGTGTGTAPGYPYPTPTATTTNSNSSPNYEFHFETTGTGQAQQVGGGAMTVSTDSTLQVSITAGNGMPLNGTGYSVGFNCQQFTIRIGNVTTTAFVKKQNYYDFAFYQGYMSYDPCANAPSTWTYDFSSALSPGHGPETITISNMYIDNCRLYGDPYDGGCGLAAAYSSYQVDGYIAVTTN
jgi:hypothetical protein